MKIEIVTPYQNLVSDEAEEVYAQGPKGEFGVLPGYAHYVTPLCVGRLFYTKQGKRVSFVIDGGLMEVFHDRVTVLADQIERAENIDAAQAKAEIQKIDHQLAHDSLEPQVFDAIVKQRDREMARLQVAGDKH